MIASEAPEINESSVRKEQAEISLQMLFDAIRRHKKFVCLFVVTTTILGAVLVFLLPNEYTAETVLLPPGQGVSASAALASQVGGAAMGALAGGSLGLKSQGEMYVSLLHTRTLENAVIQRFALMQRYHAHGISGARKQLESNAQITFGVKDGLIRIDVTDRDPNMASAVANGYVEEYRKFSANLAVTEAAQRRQFFQSQLEDAKNKLANAEVALKNTEQSTGVLQIDSQARALIESAANLRAQVSAKEVQLQGLRSFSTENNPAVISARQELSALRAQLAQLGGSSDASQTSDILIPRGKMTEVGMLYIRRYRDVKYYEMIYDLLAKQFESAKLEEAQQGSSIQVVDVAMPPDVKSFPNRFLTLLLLPIAGFILSLVIVFCMEYFQQQA